MRRTKMVKMQILRVHLSVILDACPQSLCVRHLRSVTVHIYTASSIYVHIYTALCSFGSYVEGHTNTSYTKNLPRLFNPFRILDRVLSSPSSSATPLGSAKPKVELFESSLSHQGTTLWLEPSNGEPTSQKQ